MMPEAPLEVLLMARKAAAAVLHASVYVSPDETGMQIAFREQLVFDAKLLGDSLSLELIVVAGDYTSHRFLSRFCEQLGLVLETTKVPNSHSYDWKIIGYKQLPEWFKLTLTVKPHGAFQRVDPNYIHQPKKPKSSVVFADAPGVMARLEELEVRIKTLEERLYGEPNP